jgi:hypothetical protein
MPTYVIPHPSNPERRQAFNDLLSSLEKFYNIECIDAVVIHTDLRSLAGVLSGLPEAIVVNDKPKPKASDGAQEARPRGRRKRQANDDLGPEQPAKTPGPDVKIITDSVERQIARNGAIGGRKL